MARFEVKTNAKLVRHWIDDAARSQVPFATAKTITQLGTKARDDARARMRTSFKLRSKGLPKGVGRVAARKKDWPKVEGAVVVQPWAAFLKHHATGGVKLPLKGKFLAVPTRMVARRRTSTGRIPKKLKPRTVMGSDEGYIAEETIKRRRKEKARAREKGLTRLFLLIPRVRIAPRWPLQKIVRDRVRRSYSAMLVKNLQLAIKSKRS